jgi:hypothetical protein
VHPEGEKFMEALVIDRAIPMPKIHAIALMESARLIDAIMGI